MKERHGYEVIDQGRIPELDSEFVRLLHRKSGAELLHLRNADTNKVFGVTFRTLPPDSTGLPHILEHSVLCGSRRYPVKEPFVHLLKASLQTFLNAFTFPDKTCYPIASENLPDFLNLARVYLDAVFFPLIGEPVFQQEGWHYEMSGPQSDLTRQGVVYNEMKGAYSDPLDLLDELTKRSLFDGTPYGRDSGGDPAVIPSLTYEQFKAFHEQCYHPSNSLIYLYGDAPPEPCFDLLDEYLNEFEAGPRIAAPELPARWSDTRRHEFPFDAGDAPLQEKAAMTVLNWLWPEDASPLDRLMLTVLDYILIGSSASPLRKALIDSGLGESLLGNGLHLDLRQLYFSVGLKGIRREDAERVEHLIIETLGRLHREGVDPAMCAAAMNAVEFSIRENNTGGFPQGLALMLRALSGWLYGQDPIPFLAFETPLAELKRRAAEPRFFEQLIDRHLLQNRSRTMILLVPAPGHAGRQALREKEQLVEVKAAMSEQEREETVRRTLRLKAQQQQADDPQDVAKLPVLRLEDLSRRQPEVTYQEERAGDQLLLCHELPAHGLVYVDLAFDVHGLDPEMVAPLQLFCRALRETGTAREDFVSLSQRIDRETGGISIVPWVSSAAGSARAAALMLVRGKATIPKTLELCTIIGEMLCSARLDDRERIRQLVRQERSALEARVIPAGHQFALQRACAAWEQASWASERINGIGQIGALRELEKQIETNWEGVCGLFARIKDSVIRRSNLRSNITADSKGMGAGQAGLRALMEVLPSGPTTACDWPNGSGRPDEGFIVPSTIHYVAKAADLYRLGYRFHGSMQVAVKHLNTNYLWQKVRVEGGAYSGNSLYNIREKNFRGTQVDKFTFITALIRPQNLLRLQQSIETNLQGRAAWQWIVVVDGKSVAALEQVPPVNAHVIYAQHPIASYGFLEKNIALELVQEDTWVYFLDDDTELHPNFYTLFSRIRQEHPSARGMVFGQLLPDGTVRVTNAGEEHYVSKIDMCQFIVRRGTIGYHRFFGVFGADGEFFTRIYRSQPEAFVFNDEVGFHHNNLRIGEPWTKKEGYGRPY